jgi:Uma2 family endonuclease
MASIAPAPTRLTSARYFALVADGTLGPDDRVELLEGVVVTMAPENARHASATRRVARALARAVGDGACVSEQHPLVLAGDSAPQPDVAVLPGRLEDYDTVHPRSALLVVEVADSSLAQDRLTKTGLYAAAGVPEYWIVNLRDEQVEVHRAPDAGTARYAEQRVLGRGDVVRSDALPGAAVAVDDLLPVR